MLSKLKIKTYNLLRGLEKFTQTDMVYLAKGGSWLTLGQSVASASSFLLAIAFANLLPRETYGIYQYVLSITGILTATTLNSINTSLMRSVAKGCEGNFHQAMVTRMKWGCIGGLTSIFLGLYYFLQQNYILMTCFLIAGIFIPFMEPLGIFGDFLKGKKLFKLSTKFKIASRILSAIFMVTTLFLTNNIFLVILAYFIPRTLIRLSMLLIVTAKIKINKKEDPNLISYGKHLSFMSLFQTFASSLDKIFIFHYLGAAELAIYYFAIAPEGQIKGFLSFLKTLAFPKFSKANQETIRSTLPKKILKMELTIIIPVILVYIAIAPLAYKLIFPNYLESIFYSQIYILTLLFFPKTFLSSSLVAQVKKKALYILRFASPLLRIIILFVSVQLYGLPGIVFGSVLAGGINFILYYAFFTRYLKK